MIDEVHSYDLYMSTLLDRLLIWLVAIGSSVIMLSATLPSGRRMEMLSSCLGKDMGMDGAEYPRISWTTGGSAGCSSFRSSLSNGRRKVVGLEWIKDDPESLYDRISSSIKDGGSVAVICDTVLKAQRTYADLRDRFKGTDVAC